MDGLLSKYGERKQIRVGINIKMRVSSYQEGLKEVEQVKKRRKRRGYEFIGKI